jgi:hypothetical protein
MSDADIIEKYLHVLNRNAGQFSCVELQLFKLTGHTASRRMIFRETFEQGIILKFEYDCLIAWEDRFANGDYGVLVRAQKSVQKATKDEDYKTEQTQRLQMQWDELKRERKTHPDQC